jgi:hypothetical protein
MRQKLSSGFIYLPHGEMRWDGDEDGGMGWKQQREALLPLVCLCVSTNRLNDSLIPIQEKKLSKQRGNFSD